MVNFNHEDNNVPFFNDSTFGVSVNYDQIIRYANDLGIKYETTDGNILFSMSGFARVRNSNINVLFDIGSIKPKSQPGHAHASTLSLECSFLDERFLVNSGISTYENSELRLLQRGTSLHNTIEINNTNSSEVWSSFRVGRKANTSLDVYSPLKNRVKASHDGYNFFDSIQNVSRSLEISKHSILIVDSISSSGSYSAKGHWYISPKMYLYESCNKSMRYVFESESRNTRKYIEVLIEGARSTEILKTKYYSSFNKEEDNYCIVYDFNHKNNNSVITKLSLLV
jgi:hypothetical protein